MDMNHYNSLTTLPKRANYLLTQKITTNIELKDLTPVLQAKIGDMGLPVYSDGNETAEQVIAKAKVWLENLAKD